MRGAFVCSYLLSPKHSLILTRHLFAQNTWLSTLIIEFTSERGHWHASEETLCSPRSQSIYLSIYLFIMHHNVHHYDYRHSFKQSSCIDERNMQIYHQGSIFSNDMGQFLSGVGRFPRICTLVVFILLCTIYGTKHPLHIANTHIE